MVAIALPSIAEDLAFAEGDLQWVITAYVLVTGGLLMLGGRAADLFGRRRIFLAGLGTFTLASLDSVPTHSLPDCVAMSPPFSQMKGSAAYQYLPGK